jgi:hypothetical protein
MASITIATWENIAPPIIALDDRFETLAVVGSLHPPGIVRELLPKHIRCSPNSQKRQEDYAQRHKAAVLENAFPE